MPLTFIDIERQKNWRIGVFFLFLLTVYFVITVLLCVSLFPVLGGPPTTVWLFSGIVALFVAGIHFFFAAYDTVNSVIRVLGAAPPDPLDEIHGMFLNIMQEIHVVTGNRRKIQCVVIPSFSLNALAAADLKGNAVIGITEGLLSRLTRPQIEAVVAHEAHHVLSGDCLGTTIAASIFGAYSAMIGKMGGTARGRSFALPMISIAWLLLKLSYLLNMFISREREYRADAASVRMTRDPIALAETLHLLSRSWRGAGFIGSGLEMLCIVNPQATLLDETEGFWADLVSTHPPLAKRMNLLLNMARVSMKELDMRAEQKARPVETPGADGPFYAMSPQQKWQGPYTQHELTGLPWFSPLTWVTQGRDHPVHRAGKDPLLNEMFLSQVQKQTLPLSKYACPDCRQPLVTMSYEGTQIQQCRFCAGTLVDNEKIPRIIARTGRDRPCPERIKLMARSVVTQNQVLYPLQKRSVGNAAVVHTPCPKCANPMFRGFYSQAHLIEIDRCSMCNVTWFEKDELHMLQCLIENRIAPEVTGNEKAIRKRMQSAGLNFMDTDER